MVVTIVIFIVVLALLILVHEAGHFFIAKWTGMRVDEFGLGFPPRAASYQPEGSVTTYTLNWLKFLVRILKILTKTIRIKIAVLLSSQPALR
ncbi:MAG: hypothetical protein BRC25_02635 [Parcubacteria group bacterium SW_6_46_9]|nr:MAG: hypothetical protein BRC25_02635 [Parcubacteria group bacterium SW_6_46_9]